MTPAGWLLSALSTTHRQTLPDLLSRVPSTITLSEAASLLAVLVTEGKAVRHEADAAHASVTYTRAVAT